MSRPSAAAARRVAPGFAVVQAGHEVCYFAVADDLLRVLTYVSACRLLPLNECPYVQSTGQSREGLSDGDYVAAGAAGAIYG
jgi:hypothetical protein